MSNVGSLFRPACKISICNYRIYVVIRWHTPGVIVNLTFTPETKMKKTLLSVLTAVLFLLSTLTPAIAGHRHARHHYKPHHYHYKHPYKHHYKHHRYYRFHNHHDHFWVSLGVGVLTGALIHAITTPPRRSVVYTTPPVIERPNPPVVYYQNSPPATPPQPDTILRMVTVSTDLLNVRFGPDTNSSIVTQLGHGAVVGVIGAAPDWLYIRTSDGLYGWVMMKYTYESGNSSKG